MVTDKDIYEKQLKDGKDYIYIGRVKLKKGDKFVCSDKEIVIKEILDQVHFLDSKNNAWHSNMFHDRKCRHIEENLDQLEL